MSTTRPLEGIRVLDLTVALSGPYASLLLGGMGAEVIRIESPGGSDIGRSNPPFLGGDGLNFGAPAKDEISLSILNRARNKKSITLDLKSEQGKALFMQLAQKADVILENFSEGVTAKLGVDYERVRPHNPNIIYASIKAMGEPSAYPGLKGMDIIVQALSGIMEVTGFADGPPTRCGLPIADMVAPMYAVNGILAALIHRGRTGVGQHVQVSMLDCLASWVAEEHFDVMGQAGYPMRSGNFHDRLAPFGVYRTRDGHIAIVAFHPEWMRGLLDALGQPELIDDPRFAHRGPRMRHATELNAIIEAWTSQRTSAEAIAELGRKRGVPAAPVRTPQQMLDDRRLHERGAILELSHPHNGPTGAMGMGLPIQFSATPSQFDQPAMALGAANEDVYTGLLGLSPEQINSLREQGIV
ncbi:MULTISPECIES: CaiB/BaiF CoA-transferase family protein [unclassified Pseudomonas]|uniref:CaiB/BaiF CoA transferase family protein n=1 Tax=unclassified Pseudomonas TaxID=196821 RepID=UPI001AE9C25C|nr:MULTISPECIES: CaiB/BaiF CoA-transferase family protein [unclassified Pseudomonas]MBP2271428.1 formyl-CoA transferase [Pseudomonas sp. BP6]MBP2289601.1 formyl-CoA transferase [Pseudomonas sp. BP7]HDS1695145.1 CoA transferase [Pseudomonas putida]HDS1700315.1 CoA transferase [Pseudomonas putida]